MSGRGGVAAQVLRNLGVDLEKARREVTGLLGGGQGPGGKAARKRTPTQTLDQFGRDLTELAREGKLTR